MILFGIPMAVLLDMTITAIMTVWSPGPNNILLLSNASIHFRGECESALFCL